MCGSCGTFDHPLNDDDVCENCAVPTDRICANCGILCTHAEMCDDSDMCFECDAVTLTKVEDLSSEGSFEKVDDNEHVMLSDMVAAGMSMIHAPDNDETRKLITKKSVSAKDAQLNETIVLQDEAPRLFAVIGWADKVDSESERINPSEEMD